MLTIWQIGYALYKFGAYLTGEFQFFRNYFELFDMQYQHLLFKLCKTLKFLR